ncbi:MAG: ribosome biogenesis GTPase YlqF [Clostridiales bacterium]|jgi:ribosome biogenesis GTPase A|nr:ribosome biogenesis GTPase YlqF [Clostridiales bacterium]
MNNIQWYPGHMTKALRMMKENLALVDILIELLDARIPISSKNPDIDGLAQNKKRIIVLNKADLADEAANAAWAKYYEGLGFAVVAANSNAGKGLKDVERIARNLMSEKIARAKARGRLVVPTRAMIVGVPNVGKSTMINRYAGKNMAKVADRPGVTKGKQWITISPNFELLDTPGILWPKFETEGDLNQGLNLALTGAINDNILDREKLAQALIDFVQTHAPSGLAERYKISLPTDLEKIAEARGFKLKDGDHDLLRTAVMLLDEFRGGKLGRITLEMPN